LSEPRLVSASIATRFPTATPIDRPVATRTETRPYRGPILGGYVFDLAQSYNTAFIGPGVVLVAAVILVNRLGAHAYPAQRHAEPDFASEPAAS